MKRIGILILIAGLLLCGCRNAEKAEQPTAPEATTEATAEATTEATIEATTEATTEATEPQEELVTVYLLESSFLCDSGKTEYYYDEHNNIDHYKVFNMENDLLFTTRFEEKDANGMAGYVYDDWGEDRGEGMRLTHFADGKRKEFLLEGSNFSGCQYEYDLKGDITEKREYWEGILENTVYYEYDGEELIRVYCALPDGENVFSCRVIDGRIIEKVVYSEEGGYSYFYTYDENGNLTQVEFLCEGERSISETFVYRAVEVDFDRAGYLRHQQNALISVP